MKGIRTKNSIVCIFLALFAVAGIVSCGLDTFYVLKPPYALMNSAATISNEDFNNNYVEFYTNEAGNSSLPADFKFTGTEIFYKIYSNKDDASSFINQIDAVNDETHYGSAAEKLVSSYKLLRLAGSGDSPFVIPANPLVNKRVRIRLAEYAGKGDTDTNDDFKSLITIDGVQKGQPVRAESNYSFNFGHHQDDTNSPVPASGDSDFSGSSGTGIYYVNLFAVAFGHDVTYKTYYSNVLFLGTLKINKDNYNNW